jgi:hypothetical protein
MKEENEIRRARLQKGLCQFCGIKAANGCCPRHSMNCPLCDGSASVSTPVWEAFYGKKFATQTAGRGVGRATKELKEWIFDQLDAIDTHGCKSCWSDDHNCTCGDSNDVDQSFRSDADQFGAKRRRTLLV